MFPLLSACGVRGKGELARHAIHLREHDEHDAGYIRGPRRIVSTVNVLAEPRVAMLTHRSSRTPGGLQLTRQSRTSQ
jgi:hypothetical protein